MTRIHENDWGRMEQNLSKAAEDALYWEDVCNDIVEILGAEGVILVPTNPNFRGQWMSCSSFLKTTLGRSKSIFSKTDWAKIEVVKRVNARINCPVRMYFFMFKTILKILIIWYCRSLDFGQKNPV